MFEERGQLSAEFVLVAAAIIAISLVIGIYAYSSSENNNVLAAAKSGFINASNNISYVSGNVIRFNDMSLNNTVITIRYYSKKPLTSSDINDAQTIISNYIRGVTNKTYTIVLVRV